MCSGGNTIADGVRHSVQLCGSLGIMLYLSPKLTSVMLAVAPAIAVTGLFYGKFVRAASNKVAYMQWMMLAHHLLVY